MSLRVALTLAAVCVATPLAAAEAPDAQKTVLAAGLSGPEADSTTAPRTASGDAAPRRYSLHREYGETPDPAAFARPQAAAEQDLVLAPGFFEPLPPTLAAPPAAPARDRQGRTIQQSDPDDAPQV
jgi:hypothetical protein